MTIKNPSSNDEGFLFLERSIVVRMIWSSVDEKFASPKVPSAAAASLLIGSSFLVDAGFPDQRSHQLPQHSICRNLILVGCGTGCVQSTISTYKHAFDCIKFFGGYGIGCANTITPSTAITPLLKEPGFRWMQD